MLYFGKDAHLIESELLQLWHLFKLVYFNDLNSIQSVILSIKCFVHFSVLALTYNLFQNIIINDLVHNNYNIRALFYVVQDDIVERD
jgi:hypothetical protein